MFAWAQNVCFQFLNIFFSQIWNSDGIEKKAKERLLKVEDEKKIGSYKNIRPYEFWNG